MAIVDLDQVRAMRMSSISRGGQASEAKVFPRVKANIAICRPVSKFSDISQPKPIKYIDPMEEIASGPPLWMWDYLRRSGARGFFLPLSGGADSSSTAALVASMAMLVMDSIS